MILCKTSPTMRKRPKRTVCISLEEMPKRPEYILKTNADWKRIIKKCEIMIRSSLEYRQYIQFLKANLDYNRCAVLRGIHSTPEKHYSIEVHHSPYTLFDIVQVVLTKHLDEYGEINLFNVCKEVMELHYEGKVGLIPLTVTVHEMVHNGKIFIPLNLIYQDYAGFTEEYSPWIESLPRLQDKILSMCKATEECNGILQDYNNALKPEFVYLNVDGFDFPNVPDSWAARLSLDEIVNNSDAPADNMVFKIGDDLPQ